MCLRLVRYWREALDQRVVALWPASGELEQRFVEMLPGRVHAATSGGESHLSLLRALVRLFRRHPADAVLIHCFGVHHVVAALGARIVGIRYVAAWAGNPPPSSRSTRGRWAAVLLASRLVRCPVAACSHAVEAQLRTLGVGLPPRSRTIPNGIDADSSSPRADDLCGGVDPVIGMVARLDAIKDHATLIKAFGLLVRVCPGAELWIVGDGTQRRRLEELAGDLGVADAVRFWGNRADIAELLARMHLYVFSTSRDEGFGIALIEAMAAGLPIVASDVPACREVLAAGEAGVLVPPADSVAMAEAIQSLLTDPVACARLTTTARARVMAEYSVGACARRWHDLLFQCSDPASAKLQCAS